MAAILGPSHWAKLGLVTRIIEARKPFHRDKVYSQGRVVLLVIIYYLGPDEILILTEIIFHALFSVVINNTEMVYHRI